MFENNLIIVPGGYVRTIKEGEKIKVFYVKESQKKSYDVNIFDSEKEVKEFIDALKKAN